jgi:hypothetical protein
MLEKYMVLIIALAVFYLGIIDSDESIGGIYHEIAVYILLFLPAILLVYLLFSSLLRLVFP